MFFLYPLQALRPSHNILLDIDLHLLNLMIQHHQIPIIEIETIQLITGLFCINHVLVDDVRGTLGGGGVAGADLTYGPKFAEEVEEFAVIDVVGEVFDEEDAIGFRGEFVGAGHFEE